MSEYTYPRLDIPQAREVAVFRAFEQVLRNDPILATTVRTWSTWRGETQDLKTPEFATCPYVRMTPANMSYEPITEKQHRTPMQIQLFLATAGTDVDQMGNLFGAIYRALFPWNDTARREQVNAIMLAAGASRPVIRLSAFTVNAETQTAPYLLGVGAIDFNVLVDT